MSTNAKASSQYTPTTRKWTEKEWLYDQYWNQIKTINEVANETDVSRQSILRAMKRAGIPRRPPTLDCETPQDVARAYGRADSGLSSSTSFSTPTRTWDEIHDAAAD